MSNIRSIGQIIKQYDYYNIDKLEWNARPTKHWSTPLFFHYIFIKLLSIFDTKRNCTIFHHIIKILLLYFIATIAKKYLRFIEKKKKRNFDKKLTRDKN